MFNCAITVVSVDNSDVNVCFQPPVLTNAEVTVFKDQIGIGAMYVCKFGFRFTEGGTSRTNICFDGKWYGQIKDCEGLMKLGKLSKFENSFAKLKQALVCLKENCIN